MAFAQPDCIGSFQIGDRLDHRAAYGRTSIPIILLLPVLKKLFPCLYKIVFSQVPIRWLLKFAIALAVVV